MLFYSSTEIAVLYLLFRVNKDEVEKLCTRILDSSKNSASAAVSEKKTAQFYRKLLRGVSPKPKIKPEIAEVSSCTLTVNLFC